MQTEGGTLASVEAAAALDRFSRTVKERHDYARAWKERTGGKVVGYFCSYVPEEVFYALGVLPVRILGSHEPQDLTERHIFGMFCPYSRDVLAQGLSGRYDYLDGLVFAHCCPHIRQSYESWRIHRPVVHELAGDIAPGGPALYLGHVHHEVRDAHHLPGNLGGLGRRMAEVGLKDEVHRPGDAGEGVLLGKPQQQLAYLVVHGGAHIAPGEAPGIGGLVELAQDLRLPHGLAEVGAVDAPGELPQPRHQGHGR